MFQPVLRKFVSVFFDDILTHLEHLQVLLQLLSDHQLFVKLSKCSFGLNEIEWYRDKESLWINQIWPFLSLITREHILIQLQQNLHKAQQLMKNQADKKRKHVTLEIGDLALFKLQPYRQVTVSSRQNQKLVLSF